MGLQELLGYEIPSRNGLHRTTARVMSTRAGAVVAYHTAAPLDRLVNAASRGSQAFTQWLAGIPPVWLTVTGIKTGQPRTTPLFGIPFSSDLALIGTGVGQAPTPAWVRNLLANPDATIGYRSRKIPVMSRHAEPEEEEIIWETGTSIYLGFSEYRKRLTRKVHLFVLEPR